MADSVVVNVLPAYNGQLYLLSHIRGISERYTTGINQANVPEIFEFLRGMVENLLASM